MFDIPVYEFKRSGASIVAVIVLFSFEITTTSYYDFNGHNVLHCYLFVQLIVSG